MLQLVDFTLCQCFRWGLESVRERVVVVCLPNAARRWTGKCKVAQRDTFEVSQFPILWD